MKKTLTISFDAEKLSAIQSYMAKKEGDLQSEIDDIMQKLYEKHVPQPVREYIESRSGEATDPPVRPKHPQPKQTTEKPKTTAQTPFNTAEKTDEKSTG